MKLVIAIIVVAVSLNIVNGVVYEEEDVYDDTEVNDRSNYELSDEDSEIPAYNIKDAPILFVKFINDYHKEYKTEKDYKKHYGNFVRNLEKIIENNKRGHSISDINMFADYGDGEFALLG